MSKTADFEKLIVQLDRQPHLIPYSDGQYIRSLNEATGHKFAIRKRSGIEIWFSTKQQLSLILSKLVADLYSSTKG